MTAYELIQELAQLDADEEIHFSVEGYCWIEEPETGRKLYGYIEKNTSMADGVFKRNKSYFIDVEVEA